MALITATLTLANCGGGGSNDTSTNTNNQDPSPTSGAIDRSLYAQATDGLTTVGELDGALSGDPTALDGDAIVYNIATLIANDVDPLAITTTTFFCNSPDPQNIDAGNGSITSTVDDQDPLGISTGDSVTTTFNQCTQFGRTLNGTRTHTIDSLTGQPYVTTPWSIETTRASDLTITASERTVSTKNVSTMIANSEDGVIITRSISGTGTRTVTNVNGSMTRDHDFTIITTQDFDLQTSTKSFSISGSRDNGGTRNINTVTPLTGSLGEPPTSGVVEIGETIPGVGLTSFIRITAQPDGQALIEIDRDNDGVMDLTVTVPWFAAIGFGGIILGNGLGIPPITGVPVGPISPPPSGAPIPPEGTTPPIGTMPPGSTFPPGTSPPISTTPPSLPPGGDTCPPPDVAGLPPGGGFVQRQI